MTKPVVALDIDGTLGDYHGHFTRFAEAWTGRSLPDPAAINPGLPLYKHLGMSKATYRQCKLAYRRGGLKRSMPAYEGAADLVRHMRSFGAKVWICTTRPYLKFDGIDDDTRHWLRRNGIHAYDGLIFSTDHKLRDLRDATSGWGKVILVADDLPEQMDKALRVFGSEASGGPARVLRDQPYNGHYIDPTYRRAYKCADIRYVFMDALDRHKRGLVQR